MKAKAFIFIGRSGSGKGTQREFLEAYLNENDLETKTISIETGARFRKFIEGESYIHKLSNEAYQNGTRQPDFLASYMWVEALIDSYKGTSHLVFDGTPRSKNEALMLETALRFLGFEKPNIVYLNISDEVAHERLKGRGRLDDLSKEKNDKRLKWFAEDVLPAIDYYKSNDYYNFLDINGENSVDEVKEEIFSKLGLK